MITPVRTRNGTRYLIHGIHLEHGGHDIGRMTNDHLRC